MQRFVNFVFYNVIVYLLYSIIDKVFTFLHFYSSSALGNDLSVMPTQSDMTFIFINIVISTVLGYILFKKLKDYFLE